MELAGEADWAMGDMPPKLFLAPRGSLGELERGRSSPAEAALDPYDERFLRDNAAVLVVLADFEYDFLPPARRAR